MAEKQTYRYIGAEGNCLGIAARFGHKFDIDPDVAKSVMAGETGAPILLAAELQQKFQITDDDFKKFASPASWQDGEGLAFVESKLRPAWKYAAEMRAQIAADLERAANEPATADATPAPPKKK